MKHTILARSIGNSLLIVIVAIIAVVLQVLDKTFGNTFTISLGSIFPQADLMVFGLMVLITITIQFVLIRKSRESVRVEKSKSRLGKIVLVIANVLQYSASGILVIILLEAVFTSQYDVDLLETVVGINLITSNILLAILSSRLVRTYRNSPSRVVLAYTVAIAMLSLSSIITFIYVDNFLQGKPDYIASDFNPFTSYSPTASPSLVFAYQSVGIISFVSLWIATIFLTYHYASKSMRIKYWTIVSIPLVYFASLYIIPYLQNLDLLGTFGVGDNPIYAYAYNFFLNTVRTAGGIMFGVAFFVLSRTILHAQLKKSVIITGIGLILLLGANATSLIIITTYPPWGILSVTFMITGSYLIIVGLDSAAFYIATDSSLRGIIARSPRHEYDFLKSLGRTEAEHIVTDKVNSISKQVYNKIQYENLFAISSEPSNVQEYIKEVLSEAWKIEPGLFRKAKDKLSNGNHG
jgi:hypothetical protein